MRLIAAVLVAASALIVPPARATDARFNEDQVLVIDGQKLCPIGFPIPLTPSGSPRPPAARSNRCAPTPPPTTPPAPTSTPSATRPACTPPPPSLPTRKSPSSATTPRA